MSGDSAHSEAPDTGPHHNEHNLEGTYTMAEMTVTPTDDATRAARCAQWEMRGRMSEPESQRFLVEYVDGSQEVFDRGAMQISNWWRLLPPGETQQIEALLSHGSRVLSNRTRSTVSG